MTTAAATAARRIAVYITRNIASVVSGRGGEGEGGALALILGGPQLLAVRPNGSELRDVVTLQAYISSCQSESVGIM